MRFSSEDLDRWAEEQKSLPNPTYCWTEETESMIKALNGLLTHKYSRVPKGLSGEWSPSVSNPPCPEGLDHPRRYNGRYKVNGVASHEILGVLTHPTKLPCGCIYDLTTYYRTIGELKELLEREYDKFVI